MQRPAMDAPRLAWQFYVFERVAPILAAKDERFAAMLGRGAPLVRAVHEAIHKPGALPDDLIAAATGPLAELIAVAQAVFDTVDLSDEAGLVQQLDSAFAPYSLFVYRVAGRLRSRFWWEHGVEMPQQGEPYFAPEASRYEAVYIQECNRRRIPDDEVLRMVREDGEVGGIERAAGIGLFQSSPDDSELVGDNESDAEGIIRAGGIGIFQTAVPSPPTKKKDE